jgi:hypothetical protein
MSFLLLDAERGEKITAQSKLPKGQGFIGGFWNHLLWNNLTQFGLAGISEFHGSHKRTGQENSFEIQGILL